jgi:hypothetical protein
MPWEIYLANSFTAFTLSTSWVPFLANLAESPECWKQLNRILPRHWRHDGLFPVQNNLPYPAQLLHSLSHAIDITNKQKRTDQLGLSNVVICLLRAAQKVTVLPVGWRAPCDAICCHFQETNYRGVVWVFFASETHGFACVCVRVCDYWPNVPNEGTVPLEISWAGQES